MSGKISLEDVENSLKALIEPLVRATKQAQWEGIGGASSYLSGGRIEILEKKYGPKIKLGALKIIFKNIADAAEHAFDPVVLQKFVESNFDVIKACVKEDPQFFITNKRVAEICKKVLPPKERRSFHRFMKIAVIPNMEEGLKE